MAMTPDEQYSKVCSAKLNEIIEHQKSLLAEQRELNRKLFVDNGSPCFQTKIDRNTRWIKGITGAGVIIYVSTISALIGWLWRAL